MRDSSTTWTITFQPSPSSCSRPRIDSIGRPSSCGSSRRTCWITSRPESFRFDPFRRFCPRCSAILIVLPHERRPLLADRETLQERLLAVFTLLFVNQALVEIQLELQQLAPDVILVVELTVGLGGDLLGHPGHAPDRRQRERDQSGENAHRQLASSSSTNEWGGSGPVYLTRRRAACSLARRSSLASNSGTRCRSTRKDAFRATRSCEDSVTSTVVATGDSASTSWCESI